MGGGALVVVVRAARGSAIMLAVGCLGCRGCPQSAQEVTGLVWAWLRVTWRGIGSGIGIGIGIGIGNGIGSNVGLAPGGAVA